MDKEKGADQSTTLGNVVQRSVQHTNKPGALDVYDPKNDSYQPCGA